MTNLELIRQKCIEANPDIVECLSCKGQGFTSEHDVPASHNGGDGSCETCPVQVQCIDCSATGKIEPRPIRLADVLLAIKKDGFSLSSDGIFLENIDYETYKECGAWNLRKDDLNEQSEETINFLAELLK